MDHSAFAQALHDLGYSMFSDKASYPKPNAQANLQGRTHFVDDDTLRFFGSRILSAHEKEAGLLFVIIESSYLDWNKTKRGFRFAVFDVFGTCIARPEIEQASRSRHDASMHFFAWYDSFDLSAHYAKAIEEKAARQQREVDGLRAIVADLAKVPA